MSWPEAILTVGVALAALVVLRQFWSWRAAIERSKVRTPDPEFINRDQQPHSTPVLPMTDWTKPASKGFQAQADRRAHVHHLKRKVH